MSGLSPQTRFEVFKRDGFTCRYCGRKSPEVVLEVDHIVPKCDDGTDDPINLATSCWECNRGKGGVSLGEVMTGEDPHDRAVLLLEQQRQLEEYNRVLANIRIQRERCIAWLEERWDDLTGRWLSKADVAWLEGELSRTPVESIYEAMRLAASRGAVWNLKYTAGILRNARETAGSQESARG